MIFTVRLLRSCRPENVRRLGAALGVNLDCDDNEAARRVTSAANRSSAIGMRERWLEEKALREEFEMRTQWAAMAVEEQIG